MEQHEQLGNILLSIDSDNMTDEFLGRLSNIENQIQSLAAQIEELK